MADDNILRSYRSTDASRRAASASSRDLPDGSDPLAELARLIGQNDPFSEAERAPAARPRNEQPSGDWRQTAAALARQSMHQAPADDGQAYGQPEPEARSYRTKPNHNFLDAPPAAAYREDEYADAEFDDAPPFGESRGASSRGQVDRGHVDHEDDERDLHDEDQHPDDRHARSPRQADHDDENYFFDDAAAPDDDAYDDPPRTRAGGNGMMTALVLISCAVLGTAGAYGYRAYFSAPRSGDAPIISADTRPSKLITSNGDAQSGKSIQDRVGSPANERVVPHQEDPVTLGDPTSPRVVLPAPFTTSPGPGPGQPGQPGIQSGQAVPSNQSAGAAQGEAKKVRTVPIRPDGSDARTGGNTASAQPMQLAAPTVTSSVPRQTVQSVPVQTTPVQTTAARPVQPTRNSGAPLSLDPGGDPPATYQPPVQPSRVANANSNSPQLASVPNAVTGGYVVQVSSQRSESEAQASFRSLQTKYPRELGDRDPIVRRADLGQKGIYYRAMVGPFASASDADQFCSGLKADGGNCIVQRN